MAENPIGDLLVRLKFDGAEFERGITKARRELKSYGDAVKNSTKHAKNQNYSMQATNRALENMQVQYRGMATYVDTLNQRLKEVDRSSPDYARYSNEISRYQGQMYELAETYQTMQKEAYIANSSFTKIGDGMITVGNVMQGVGQGVQSLGDAFTRVGAVATSAGALFVKQAVEFEHGMVNVQKTTNASAEQMKVFTEGIRGLAREMPIAHNELAELASVAGQLGIAQDELLGFTETMAKVGTATSLSASQASEAFARFTNITGSGTDSIENLGSALVHLGNNFATTETEIMNLATQLVGTLSSLGVAEAEILGLAGAMSALGITAERGGSSMSRFFSDMSSAVSQGGEELEKFAAVAQMTSEQFANLFSQDPVSALQAFIDGMVALDAQGQSFTQTLDAMDIQEVRLRDTLLRLAGGHETLNSAVASSTEAYADATALQQEYDLMMQSTAMQWEVVKNQFRDVAMEIGVHLLPVIVDLLQETDGLIDMAKSVAEWFGQLDEGTRRTIVTFGALSIALGPVLSTLGQFISGTGNLIVGLGDINKAIPKTIASYKTFGAITDTVTTGTGLLSGGLTALGNSALLPLVGIIGIVAGAYMLLNSESAKANRRMAEFPDITGITETQAQSLRNLSDDLTALNVQLANVETLDTTATVSALQNIGAEVSSLNEEKIQNLRDKLSSLPLATQEALAGSVEEAIAGIQAQTERTEMLVQESVDTIKNMYDEAGNLIPEYAVKLEGLTNEIMSNYSFALAENADQQREIYALLTADLSEMTNDQLVTRVGYLHDALKEEKRLFEEHKQDLYDMRAEQVIDDEEYYSELEAITESHHARMRALYGEYIENVIENYARMDEGQRALALGTEDAAEQHEIMMERIAKRTGLTREQIESILNEVDTSGFETRLASLSESTQKSLGELTPVVNDAINDFNLALENFAGGLEETRDLTDAQMKSFVDSLLDAGMTWDEIEFVAKYAEIDDNTREFMNQLLATRTEWDRLEFEDKVAKAEVEGQEAVDDMKAKVEDWNALETLVKELEVEGYRGMEALQVALMRLGVWNDLEMDTKKLIISELIGDDKVTRAIELRDLWNNEEFVTKVMNVDYRNIEEATASIEAILAEYGILQEVGPVELQTSTNAEETQSSLSSLGGYFLNQLLANIFGPATMDTETNAPETQAQLEDATSAGEDLDATEPYVETDTNVTENVTEPTTEAQGALDTLDATTATPTADLNNQASSVIRQINDELTALGQRTVYPTVAIERIDRYASGTAFHAGGLAILGDGGRREPFLTPSGRFGVSPDRDTLYDLPRGTKVWPNVDQFKAESLYNVSLRKYLDRLPRYARGTQRSFLDSLSTMKVPFSVESVNHDDDRLLGSTNQMVGLLSALLTLLSQEDIGYLLSEGNRTLEKILHKSSVMTMDKRVVAQELDEPLFNYRETRQTLNNRQKGRW